MPDIKTILTVDDQQFTSKIKAAEASVKSFASSGATATSQLENNFRNMGSGIDNLNSKISGLGTLLTGIGLTAFVKSLLDSAQQLKDMAGAADISIARMLEMGTAASTAGTNMQGFANMITKMEVGINQAVEGNGKLQVALKQVGVSFDDVKTKTPDQLFNQIASALAKIADPAQRAALATELFGKAGKMVDWKGYEEQILKLYGTMENFGASQEKAAALSDKLSVQMTLIKGAVLELLSPLMEAATGSDDMGKAMDRAHIYAKVLVGTLALVAAGTVASGFVSIVEAVKELARWMGFGAGATAVETNAIKANTIEIIKNLEASQFLSSSRSRLGTATYNVALAQQAYDAALASEGAGSAAAIAAEAELIRLRAIQTDLMKARTTIQTEMNAVLSQTVVAEQAVIATGLEASMATTAVAIEQATVKVGYFSAALGGFVGVFAAIRTAIMTALGALAAFFAPEIIGAAVAIGVIIGGLTVIWKAFGDVLTQWAKDAYDGVIKALGKINDLLDWMAGGLRKMAGLPSIEIKVKATGNNPNAVPGKAAISPSGTVSPFSQTGNDFPDSDAIKAYKQNILDSVAAYQLKNTEARKALDLQLAMVNMSAKEKEVAQATAQQRKEAETVLNGLEQKRLALEDALVNGTTEQRQAAERELPVVRKAISDVKDMQEQAVKTAKNYTEALHEQTLEMLTQKDLAAFTTQTQQQNASKLMKIQTDIAKLGKSETEKRNIDIIATARAEAQAEIDRQNAKRRAAQEDDLSLQQQRAILAEKMKGVEAEINANQILYDKSREFDTGWSDAFENYKENATNAAETAKRVFDKATQGMEDAIVNFAKTGKFEWKSFVSSIIEELLRSQLRQLIAKTFGGLGLGNQSGSSGWSLLDLLPGRASGGPVNANTPYITGEGGPELFIPKSAGTIVPNNQMSASQGLGTAVTYNINAVDAMSFKQMIARDPAFMYAVTQQGAKSIPMSRR